MLLIRSRYRPSGVLTNALEISAPDHQTSEQVSAKHLAEAVQYRSLNQNYSS